VISAPPGGGTPRYSEASIERVARAHYDGIADWYDLEFAPAPLEGAAWHTVVRLLGDGSGDLLDVGCGTGAYAAALAERGWNVTGLDVSADMLRRAQTRGVEVVQGDAAALPFEDALFDAVISTWTHTDVDDFSAVVREIARVLRARAPFVYVGPHPCFVGPHFRFAPEEGPPTLHAGYRKSERYAAAPGIGPRSVLRAQVGASHLPLGLFVQAFLAAGLQLECFEEPEGEPELGDYPYILALRWRK
jgi:SAM-dependent methyltransferase